MALKNVQNNIQVLFVFLLITKPLSFLATGLCFQIPIASGGLDSALWFRNLAQAPHP